MLPIPQRMGASSLCGLNGFALAVAILGAYFKVELIR